MTIDEAHRQWLKAEERAIRSREAGDLTATLIAESQADHWYAEWLAAMVIAAPAPSTAPAGSTARATAE